MEFTQKQIDQFDQLINKIKNPNKQDERILRYVTKLISGDQYDIILTDKYIVYFVCLYLLDKDVMDESERICAIMNDYLPTFPILAYVILSINAFISCPQNIERCFDIYNKYPLQQIIPDIHMYGLYRFFNISMIFLLTGRLPTTFKYTKLIFDNCQEMSFNTILTNVFRKPVIDITDVDLRQLNPDVSDLIELLLLTNKLVLDIPNIIVDKFRNHMNLKIILATMNQKSSVLSGSLTNLWLYDPVIWIYVQKFISN